MPAKSPDPQWRSSLARLAGTADAASAPPSPAPAERATGTPRPMALQFELREQIPAGVRRWGGPTARTATADGVLLGEVRLSVRPVARSTAGNWTRAGLTWSNLPYQASSANLDPEHQLWFSQFAALHRPLRDVQVNREPDWITLDDYQSPLLWQLLDEARQLGIEFVGGSGGSRAARVTVGSSASVGLDLSRADGGAALTLRTRATVDGELAPVASVGAVGTHGLYRFELGAEPRFVLAPLDRRLTPERLELLTERDPITIPAEAAPEFVAEFLPHLQRTAGVTSTDGTVELPEPPPAPPPPGEERETLETPRLTVRTVPTEQHDWFDLGIIVTVGEYDIPFGPLFTALAKGLTRYKLVDGTYLPLRQPLFERLFELISEAKELAEWEVTPRLSRVQAALWAEFEDLADETEEAVAWRATARGLLDTTAIPTVEHGLDAELRHYQQDGFEWLVFLYEHGLGGILADDMGLGKTLQTLALIEHARRTQPGGPPFLVVAPTSVTSTWAAEARRFAPTLRVASVGSTRTGIADVAADADVVVTSYALFRLDFESYRAVEWCGLVLDEAQFVKNHTAQVHRCARDLAVPFTLAITGTPMENNLMELWALFAIVAPGLFPSSRRFAEQYVRPIERGEGERLERLRRRIRPLMMRRTKALVAAELPPKQEQVVMVELQPEHRRLYDTVLQRERQKLFGLIDDVDRNRMIIFRSLTLLRMLALDGTLVDEANAGVPSSKLDVLLEHLDEVVAEGHRTLVFSQFTSYLGLAAARLKEAGIPYAYLDGSTRQRGNVVEGFTGGDAPVFLISLKAGGFGLTLTQADYVFLLDPWWNPAAENQAIDRAHRIGQTSNVMVYRMIAADTIEEKVLALARRKAGLFTSVLDAGDLFSSALTGDDIRALVE